MSRIDELIQQLCPDGVEYKPLEKITYYSSERVAASTLTAQNYIGVDNLLPNKKGKTISEYVPSNGNFIKYRRNNILIGNIRPYLKKIWLATHDGGTNGDVLVICIAKEYELQIIPDFLYYLLSSDDFFYYDMQYAKGAKMPRGNKNIIMEYQVPVPPLPVQEEIVRILDKFTALEAELEAELEARRKQYEFYRDQLLTFGDEVEWRPLGEIGDFTYGYTAKAQNQGDVRFIRITDIGNNGCLNKDDVKYITLSDESKKYLLKVGDLLVARTGATFGKTLIITSSGKYVYASFLIKITLDSNLIGNKFYWHFSKSKFYWKQALKLVSASSQPQFNTGALKKILVPVPPLAEQERIVAILDKFDALVNDISFGLPAELEMRRKQYEYYRDRLLTFPKKKA